MRVQPAPHNVRATAHSLEHFGARFVPVLIGVVGLVSAMYPTLLSGFSRLQADDGDTRFNGYMLEHGYRWITGAGQGSFWDAPMFFPHANAAAYSDVLLGTAPIYWLWRVVGFWPDTAFQLWQVATCLLNFAAFYVFLRRDFALTALPAAVGADLFAFGAPRLAQSGHFQLYSQFLTVVLLHALARIFASGTSSPRHWVLAAVTFTLQVYSSFYLAWFAAFGLLLAMPGALSAPQWRRPMFRVLIRDWRWVLVAGALTATALAPLGIHAWRAAAEVGVRPLSWGVMPMVPRVVSWFAGAPGSWFYAWTDQVPAIAALPMRHEHSLTFGLLTGAVAIAGLVHGRRRPGVALVGLTAAAVVLLATATLHGTDSLWKVVYYVVPGARAVRAVARIVLLLSIAAGLGVALAVDGLLRRRLTVLGLAVAVACCVEQLHSLPSVEKDALRTRTHALAKLVSPDCTSFFLSPVLDVAAQPDWSIQTQALWVSLEIGIPTVNGFSGNEPPDWPLHDSVIRTSGDEQRIATSLAAWAAKNGLRDGSVCWIKARP
jgi:hypothetical protein